MEITLLPQFTGKNNSRNLQSVLQVCGWGPASGLQFTSGSHKGEKMAAEGQGQGPVSSEKGKHCQGSVHGRTGSSKVTRTIGVTWQRWPGQGSCCGRSGDCDACALSSWISIPFSCQCTHPVRAFPAGGTEQPRRGVAEPAVGNVRGQEERAAAAKGRPAVHA